MADEDETDTKPPADEPAAEPEPPETPPAKKPKGSMVQEILEGVEGILDERITVEQPAAEPAREQEDEHHEEHHEPEPPPRAKSFAERMGF